MQRIWTLVAVCATTFMIVLDISVVAVALPSIQRGLRADLIGLQWIVDAYVLPLAGFLLTAAAFGDRVGRRGLFVVGAVTFTAGSLLCGIGPSVLLLSLARALQGVGGAVLLGVGLPLIADVYPPGRSRDLAVGAFAGVTGAGIALGPLIGGALTDSLGWRSIFLVNVPIGMCVIAVAVRFLAPSPARREATIDWPGTITSTTAFAVFAWLMIRGGDTGWASPFTLILLMAGLALIIAFFAIESRILQPMLDLRLFANSTYAAGVFAAFVIQATLVASTLYLSLYAHDVLGLGPLETGLRFLPFSVTAFCAALLAAPLLARLPLRWLVGSTAALTVVGLELLTRIDASSTATTLIPGFVVAGAGFGASLTVINRLVLAEFPHERAGAAAGVVLLLRQVGIAVGVAGLGVVYQRTIRSTMQGLLGDVPMDKDTLAAVAQAMASGTGLPSWVPTELHRPIAGAYRAATISGIDAILHLGAAVTLLATLVAFICVRGARPRAEPADRVDYEGIHHL